MKGLYTPEHSYEIYILLGSFLHGHHFSRIARFDWLVQSVKLCPLIP